MKVELGRSNDTLGYWIIEPKEQSVAGSRDRVLVRVYALDVNDQPPTGEGPFKLYELWTDKSVPILINFNNAKDISSTQALLESRVQSILEKFERPGDPRDNFK